MKRYILLVAGAAFATLAAGSAVAAGANIQPGLYETTTRLVKIEMPGLPAAAQAKQQKAVGKKETFKQCITPEEARNREYVQKGCRASTSSIAGGKINVVAQCMDGSTQRVAGTYTPTSSNLTLTTSGGTGPGRTNMVLSSVSRRIGACTGEED